MVPQETAEKAAAIEAVKAVGAEVSRRAMVSIVKHRKEQRKGAWPEPRDINTTPGSGKAWTCYPKDPPIPASVWRDGWPT